MTVGEGQFKALTCLYIAKTKKKSKSLTLFHLEIFAKVSSEFEIWFTPGLDLELKLHLTRVESFKNFNKPQELVRRAACGFKTIGYSLLAPCFTLGIFLPCQTFYFCASWQVTIPKCDVWYTETKNIEINDITVYIRKTL